MRTTKRITISDIARIGGVSKSTVSEVLNNDPKSRVNSHTFERIRKIIDDYGYTPSQQARAMSCGETRNIGLLISSSAMLGFANSFFSLILAGVEQECSRREYYCTVSVFDLTRLENFIKPHQLKRRNVDALIVAGEIASEELLLSLDVPVAILGYCKHEDFYRIDRGTSALGAFRYLAEMGHTRLFLPFYSEPEREEMQLQLDQFNQNSSRKLSAVFSGCHADIGDLNRGRELCNDVFKGLYGECSAMIANDQICCSFLQRMLETGHRCPEDFSIISRDDTPLCSWNAIPITACGGDLREYGRTAAQLLIDILEKKADPLQKDVRLPKPPELILRQSSGPAKQGSRS